MELLSVDVQGGPDSGHISDKQVFNSMDGEGMLGTPTSMIRSFNFGEKALQHVA